MKTAKLFASGRSQAVRLPKEFRFEGTEVVVKRMGEYDGAAAEAYGKLRADLRKKGTPIGERDLFIAAHAHAEGRILVTNNTREFASSEKWA